MNRLYLLLVFPCLILFSFLSCNKDNSFKIGLLLPIIMNCKLDYFVSFDNVRVGEIMAEYMIKRKPSYKLLILTLFLYIILNQFKSLFYIS